MEVNTTKIPIELPAHGYGMMARARVILDGNADAVEFCPTPPFYHILAAATYTLHDQAPQPSRSGSLFLFSVENEGRRPHKLQHFDSPGILDIKWRPGRLEDVPFLAQANADGSLSLYKMQVQDTFNVRELSKETISSAMCLSLDWDPHSGKQISISHSDGQLSVFNMESQTDTCQSSNAHGFEAWCVTYDSWRSNIIYSGGDDCHFCGWDLRRGFFQPIFREKKIHQMGVCSVQTNPHWENTLATGSYDENLRVWDVRMLEKPVLDKALGLGGGVWRLKWNPYNKGLLVAACMHNGFMIVKVQEDQISMVMEYKEHESLAYGVDWCNAPTGCIPNLSTPTEKHLAVDYIAGNHDQSVNNSDQKSSGGSSSPSLNKSGTQYDERLHFLLGSCSFYDRALHMWELDFC